MTLEDELQNEKNIWKCTYKKTTSVLCKHILWASYAIVALAAIGVIYLGCTNFVIPAITSIAWYWYAGVGIIAAYIGYSYLWCITRELTEEDWKSEEVDGFIAMLIIIQFVSVLLTMIIGVYLMRSDPISSTIVLVATLADLILWAVLTLMYINIPTKIRCVGFIGAHIHMNKRLKNKKE